VLFFLALGEACLSLGLRLWEALQLLLACPASGLGLGGWAVSYVGGSGLLGCTWVAQGLRLRAKA